jgi:glyoxylase-like metal-dependent hydrolase (beta-lactamase superfamily II)
MKIGAIEVRPVIDGFLNTKFPFTKPLPDADSLAWQDQHGTFSDEGMLVNSLGAFLVRTGDRVVMVDAGAGQALPEGFTPPHLDADDEDDPLVADFRSRGMSTDQIRSFASALGVIEMSHGLLPASLGGAGVRPDQVTDIVFTHLHFDHIGWASAGGAAFFPNATLRCSSQDLQYFLADTHDDWFSSQVFQCLKAPERLKPVVDRFETWESDGPVLPGIDVRLAPGHTPGSSVVVISSGTERAMLLGDIIHCPLELMDDDFNMIGDHDQELANRVREAYARELEGTDIPVAAGHFPDLRFGRLLPGKGVRRWTFDAQ